MLDAITVLRRSIPAAVVGVEKLVKTTGRGMASAQGFPDLPMAILDHSVGVLEGVHDDEKIGQLAHQAALQVENILLGKS